MPAVTLIRRATNKVHPTSVPESDTGLLAGLELSAPAAASLYTDAFTTGITIGSSGITTVVASELQVNLSVFGPDDGTGITIGSVPSGASTGSAPRIISMTTTQRGQLVASAGMLVWNTTDATFNQHDGTAWGPLTPFSNTATATADTTTTSGTDVLVNSMSLTPVSGTYLVWFNSSIGSSAKADIFLSLWSGGAQVTTSELFQYTRPGRDHSFSCTAKVTVNGSQAIEGRWRTGSGTATMHQRTLVILKVV